MNNITFRGTGVALVTPFDNNNSVDYKALERLIEHVIDNGVDFIVALGTTAETPTLTPAEKKEVLDFIVKTCNGDVPVVCGIGGNNTGEVISLMDEYDLSGVAGILTVVPYYNKPTQEGLYQHFKAIAQATEKPLILYNVPGRTVTNMAATTTLRLAREFKHIVAVKEASGNLVQCMELVQGKPDHFTILSGDDDLVLPQIAIGMDGVISVAANCFTKDFTDMVNAALEGNFNKARDLHYKILNGTHLLFVEGNPAGVKYVLQEMGMMESNLRLPLVSVSDGTKQKIKEALKALK
jgi:4-hydroxy-tetrahydrodipicolinate synthase